MELLGINSDFVIARALSAGVLATITLPTLAALFCQLELYQNERTRLINELIYREASQVDESRADATHTLETFVQESINILDSTESTLPSLAKSLDHIRDSRVRPLSHEIWKRVNARVPNFTVRSLVSLCLSQFKFAPTTVAVAFALIAVPLTVREYGWASAIALALIDGTIVAVSLNILKFFPAKSLTWGTSIFAGASVATTTIMVGLNTLIAGPVRSIPTLAMWISLWLLLITVTITGSAIELIRQNRRQVKADLLKYDPKLESGDYIPAKSAIIEREIARILHSEVQNRLLAKAVQLRAFTEISDSAQSVLAERYKEELRLYLLSLRNSVGGRDTTKRLPLTEVVQSLSDTWGGVVAIHAIIDDELASDAQVDWRMILEEAVTNAVKHGLATNIQIIISVEQQSVLVIVEDDGLGPRGGNPGLGSYMFTTACAMAWSLDKSDSMLGAKLNLIIPARAR